MRNSERFPFISSDPTLGEAGFRPYLPLTLLYQQSSVTFMEFDVCFYRSQLEFAISPKTTTLG